MASSEEVDTKLTQSGWARERWLAEKVKSGELPAAASDTLKKCDGFFVKDESLEEHVKLMIAFFTGQSNETPADTDQRLDGLRSYLERLLSVREMWARERC